MYAHQRFFYNIQFGNFDIIIQDTYTTIAMQLTHHKCIPCEGGVKPLTENEIMVYTTSLSNPWTINGNTIVKLFQFENFKQSMEFVQQVARIAESEQHHPDITINYNTVTLTLTTHAIKGLSHNDFIVAEKINHIAL